MKFLHPVPAALILACGGPTEPSVDHSIKEGVVPLDAPVTDVAYDAGRNVLYLAEPDFNRIAVFHLNTLTVSTPINAVPWHPTGLDLSQGGDSLFVALQGGTPNNPSLLGRLGILNLTAAAATFDTVTLPSNGFNPDRVRVMANRKALATIVGVGGRVVSYDLVARTTHWYPAGGSFQRATMARAGDRSSMVVLHNDGCCPITAVVYNAAQDVFSSILPTVNQFNHTISANQDGSLYLIGNVLFTGSLTQLRAFTPQGYDPSQGASALTPDGASAFLATATGILIVRTSDGTVTGTIPMTSFPTRIVVLDDGRAVVAFSATQILVRRL